MLKRLPLKIPEWIPGADGLTAKWPFSRWWRRYLSLRRYFWPTGSFVSSHSGCFPRCLKWPSPFLSQMKSPKKKTKKKTIQLTLNDKEEKEARLKTRCAEGGLTAHRCSIHTFHSLRQKNWRHSNRWSPPQVRWVESLQRRRCSSHQGGTGWVNEKTDGERKAEDKGQLPKGRRAPCFSRPNAIYWKKCQRDLHNGWKCEDLPVWFILILKKCQA